VSGDRLRLAHEVTEDVGVVQAVAADEDGHDALEPGAGVDVLARQVAELAIGAPVVLGEHEVPELDVALLGPGRDRAAFGAEGRAVVPEDLRRRATGPRVAHLPEVVLVEPLDAIAREADGIGPDVRRLVVAHVDGHPQAPRVQLQHLGHELPRPSDGVGLEVVAEAEVPEHLEEAEVPVRAPDGVEVVVLTPGPHAALHRRCSRRMVRRRFLAQEVGDELHHPRVGEHRRARVRRDEAGRRDERVLPGGEELLPGAA
jgi:hypothetical protein